MSRGLGDVYKRQILYAEDDFLTREIVGEKLEEEGYAVVLAKDGKEAWNEFQQNVFDAVILDVDIPVYNGYEVASLIQSENLQIPLIFYSSLTDVEYIKKGFDNGAKV